MICFAPDRIMWHKEGRGVYVRNDGLARCEKVNAVWEMAVRATVDDTWTHSTYICSALHAAQDECRRMLTKRQKEV